MDELEFWDDEEYEAHYKRALQSEIVRISDPDEAEDVLNEAMTSFNIKHSHNPVADAQHNVLRAKAKARRKNKLDPHTQRYADFMLRHGSKKSLHEIARMAKGE